jgi:glycosyltransferase involved in cell wall biosynthesis
VLVSRAFYPRVGGIETHSALLADYLHKRGHQVTVLTEAALASHEREPFPFPVVRQPNFRTAARLLADTNVVVHNQISLRALPPWLLSRRPLILIHQTWLPDQGPLRKRLAAAIKRFTCRLASNVTCSAAVGRELGLPHLVIPNTYDDSLFRLRPDVQRDQDLLFVGRLVSDKGIDLLVDALGRLAEEHFKPSLTIVGSGAEETALRNRVDELGLGRQITFAGSLRGEALAKAMNKHRIMVVPSRWQEPFGIVALEGLASGCRIVASNGGGLPEAAGPEAHLFDLDHPVSLDAALRAALSAALSAPTDLTLSLAVAAHLEHHTLNAVGTRFEQTIASVMHSK